MLITTWFPDPHRPTRDLDLLGFGDSSEESILGVFREVCAMPADDGITFQADNLRIERIREELEYGGLRLRTVANLSRERIKVVVDVGFGDAAEPGLEEIEFPVLLDSAAPDSLETAVSDLAAFLMPMAEKARGSTRNED